MMSPVSLSRMTVWPSSSMSTTSFSFLSGVSFPYIRSTSFKKSFSAVTSFSSAGPARNCSGLIESGRRGTVELGMMWGTRLPAGRS